MHNRLVTYTTYIDVRKLAHSKEVYIVKEAGYFPVLAALSERNIVAVLRAGAGHLGLKGRLDVVRSEDGGDTWLPPKVIVDSDKDDRNPALGITKSGILVLAYHTQGSYDAQGKYSPSLRNVNMFITRSHNGGLSWEKPYPLNFEALKSHSAYGKMVTLSNGTLLLSIYGPPTGSLDCEVGVQPKTNCLSYVLRSSDEGLTWKEPSLAGVDLNEGGYLLLPNNEILAVLRSNDSQQALYVCCSADGGYSWRPPQHLTEAREHPADLVLLSNNYILLTFGHRHPPYGVQGLISHDNGHSWYKRRLLFCDDRPGSDCGYTSSVCLPNGRIITAYYSAGEHQEAYRDDGAFATAVIYEESELLAELGKDLRE